MPGPTADGAGRAGRDRRWRDPLSPYVPRMVVDWLLDEPQTRHRTVPGTLVFADISGFTALTERLAAAGKVGGEELGVLLNVLFEDLLTSAYDYGANLLKWGGDAVLLHYDGTDHAPRAAAGAWAMQQTMRRIGRLRTSRGAVRLGMSIGVHTADLDVLLVGNRHRELMVAGPAASTTARMEHAAEPGQVLVSGATAALLPDRCTGAAVARDDDAHVLVRGPEVGKAPNRTPKRRGAPLADLMCASVRDHLLTGAVEQEHRWATVGFVQFAGTDTLRASGGATGLTAVVDDLVTAVQDAAADNRVTFLATDVATDGGKIVLTSGVPHSAGDDATRMLATLHRVVRENARLELRAGVACGNVFAGDYGPFYRRTYSIAGDVVNLAARLAGHAEPGQLLATPEVVRGSRTPFETTPVAPFAAKGKREPVHAVAVGGPRRAAEPVVTVRLPLIGRDTELATLLDAAERARAGTGAVVEVVGEPGIGKSRLLDELAARSGLRVLWADGDIYGQATPYQPMQRLLRQTLTLAPDVEPDVLMDAVQVLVESAAPELGPWLPLIGVVAGADVPTTPELDRLVPEARRGRLEAVTSELLGRLLREPLLVIVNDAHFMDDATCDLVRRLAADVVDRPWLIVVTRRPDSPPVTAPGAHATTLTLEPLDERAAAGLLEAAADGTPLSAHRIDALTARAGGNPLFLTELMATTLAGAELDALPDTVEAVIAARIDRLPVQKRRWLRATAVLGMSVDPDVLAAVLTGTDLADETPAGLDEFVTVQADSQLRFVHHLVRLTAYEGLPYRRRAELHARTARVLEARLGRKDVGSAALLALHCLHGGDHAAAWRYARLAGDQARNGYAAAEAAECYRQALAAAGNLADVPTEDVTDVLESLAEVRMDLGEMPAAEQALRRARVSARHDALRLARVHLTTARQRAHVGRHADALRWISRGRALLRNGAAGGDPDALRLLSRLAQRGATVRYDQGGYRAATIWARRAMTEAQQAGDPVEEAHARGLAAMLDAIAGRRVDAATMRESLALLDGVGDLRSKARAANVYGMCAYFAGDWDTAVDYYAEAEQISRSIGRDFDAAAAAANRAEVLVQQGRVDAAEAATTTAVRTLQAADATSFLGFALTIHGRVALARGDATAAAEHLAAAHRLCADMGEIDEMLTVDALTAHCALDAGDVAAALCRADQALERIRSLGTEATAEPTLHAVRGAALLALDRPAEGHLALRAALDAARRHRSRSDVEQALDALLRHRVAVNVDEELGWQRESAELVAMLGIVTERVAAGTCSDPAGVAPAGATPAGAVSR